MQILGSSQIRMYSMNKDTDQRIYAIELKIPYIGHENNPINKIFSSLSTLCQKPCFKKNRGT